MGGAGAGGASTGGGASFADVQAIFDQRCVTCHDKSKTGLTRLSTAVARRGRRPRGFVERARARTLQGYLRRAWRSFSQLPYAQAD